MRAGRLWLWATALLAAAGCEHLEPLRQGVHSTYKQELRRLATETSQSELAKGSGKAEKAPPAPVVAPASEWHAPSLLSAVQLRAPVAPGTSNESYADEPR